MILYIAQNLRVGLSVPNVGNIQCQINACILPASVGAPEAQWVKRWPADLADPSLSPVQDKLFSPVNGVRLHSLSLSTSH